VVDTPASVAVVRESVGEPGIVVERVVDLVCAGRVWLGWSAGVVVVLDLRVV